MRRLDFVNKYIHIITFLGHTVVEPDSIFWWMDPMLKYSWRVLTGRGKFFSDLDGEELWI